MKRYLTKVMSMLKTTSRMSSFLKCKRLQTWALKSCGAILEVQT